MTDTPNDRRDFLKAAAAVTAAGVARSVFADDVVGGAHVAGSDAVRVGLIGCGGRGSGAAENVLSSAKGVEVVALADAFKERAYSLRSKLKEFASKPDIKGKGNAADIKDDSVFDGLDAYEQLIHHPAVNYVMLATPPGFRPLHIQAAVAAGKNFFTEKPVGVDGTGIRKVMAAYEDSVKKGLKIAAGTQRRHQAGYIETVKQLHEGAVGDIVALRCHWDNDGIWFNKRQPNMTDLQYQLRNWYHFLWLCGDHIVEQHIHNLDVCNWVMQGHPIKCNGQGSRIPTKDRPVGDPNEVGQIFNQFSIDYEYKGGVHMHSTCRHLPKCQSDVSEHVVGTKGTCNVGAYTINGKRIMTREQDKAAADPYTQEHTDLIAAIRDNKPINELKQVAESTLTAIMGRMSAYTGRPVTWEQALNSKLDTFPAKLEWDMKLPVSPTPVPGETPLI